MRRRPIHIPLVLVLLLAFCLASIVVVGMIDPYGPAAVWEQAIDTMMWALVATAAPLLLLPVMLWMQRRRSKRRWLPPDWRPPETQMAPVPVGPRYPMPLVAHAVPAVDDNALRARR